MGRRSWGAAVHGVAKSQTRLSIAEHRAPQNAALPSVPRNFNFLESTDYIMLFSGDLIVYPSNSY